ncbi:hypothetical protein DSECCO2_651930 [anaerobic digester metagenome]
MVKRLFRTGKLDSSQVERTLELAHELVGILLLVLVLVERPPRVGIFTLGVVERLLRVDQLGILVGLQVVEQVLVVGLALRKSQLGLFNGVANRRLLYFDGSLKVGGIQLAEDVPGDDLVARLDVDRCDQPGLGRVDAGSGVAFNRAVEGDTVFQAAL